MIKLAVIADDFTGALDTGIKFAQTGAAAKMLIGTDIDFESLPGDCEIIIADTETRHLPPAESYRIIYDLVKLCMEHGVAYFYKKTDSAMRGCVGAELAALGDALGSAVHFVPALPSENRYTENGILYIDGTPVSESVFGKDPFEPVRADRVEDILGEQTKAPVVCVAGGETVQDARKGSIYVYDAASEEDLTRIAGELRDAGRLTATAGCAGFAEILRRIIDFEGRGENRIEKKPGLFTVCGTVNAKTLAQLAYAGEHGFERITLSAEQKLCPQFFACEKGGQFISDLEMKCRGDKPVIVDVDPGMEEKDETTRAAEGYGIGQEEIRVKIAERLGEVIARWLDFGLDHALILSGGDTAYGFLKQIGVREVTPVREVWQGAVLFQVLVKGRTLNIVSKSGGFGTEDFFEKVLPLLTE